MKEFGNRLREIREGRMLSLRDLASKSGIDFALISKYEQGKVKPRLNNITILAKCLQVTESQLVPELGGIPPSDDDILNEIEWLKSRILIMKEPHKSSILEFIRLLKSWYAMDEVFNENSIKG